MTSEYKVLRIQSPTVDYLQKQINLHLDYEREQKKEIEKLKAELEDAYYRNARDKYRASMELSEDEIKTRYKAKKLLTILTPLEVATVVIELSEELAKIQKGSNND